MNPLARSIEELLPAGLSNTFWCFILLRTALVFSSLFIAFVIPFFGKPWNAVCFSFTIFWRHKIITHLSTSFHAELFNYGLRVPDSNSNIWIEYWLLSIESNRKLGIIRIAVQKTWSFERIFGHCCIWRPDIRVVIGPNSLVILISIFLRIYILSWTTIVEDWVRWR